MKGRPKQNFHFTLEFDIYHTTITKKKCRRDMEKHERRSPKGRKTPEDKNKSKKERVND